MQRLRSLEARLIRRLATFLPTVIDTDLDTDPPTRPDKHSLNCGELSFRHSTVQLPKVLTVHRHERH